MKSKKAVRVTWKRKVAGGGKGHGNWSTDKKLIEAWVLEGNRSHPDIYHWLEEKEQSL